MGFQDAVASAGPYANNLHLAQDRQPHQHLITQLLQARCSSWCPTNIVKTGNYNNAKPDNFKKKTHKFCCLISIFSCKILINFEFLSKSHALLLFIQWRLDICNVPMTSITGGHTRSKQASINAEHFYAKFCNVWALRQSSACTATIG